MKSNYTYNLMRDVYNHNIGGIEVPIKQNTAMQEFIEWFKHNPSTGYQVYAKATELLKKEEEQIKQAFVAGDQRGTKDIPFNAEQYFNQTYNNK